MADLHIRPPAGSRKTKRISGRGPGGRRGATAGKGDKGQNARSGGGVRPGFEGGQMPLYRRIPRKGFSNYPFKKMYDVVNTGTLDRRFADGEVVTIESLKEKKIVKKKFADVKILGGGDLTKKLTVEISNVSRAAREKIEKAGGTVVAAAPAEEKAAEEKSAAVKDAGASKKPAAASIDAKPPKPEQVEDNEENTEEKGSVDGE